MESWPCLNCRRPIIETTKPGRKTVLMVHLDPDNPCPYPVAVLR